MKKIIFSFILLFSMLSFCVGYRQTIKVEAITTENIDLHTLPEVYTQTDSRWSMFTIGGGTLGSNGCGILSLVNAVNFITGNFMNPIEVATFGHQIGAYNGIMGGGTGRDLFYPYLDDFEYKYGFEVVKSSIYSNIFDERLQKHLKEGGVSVAHVKGHFIAIVGINEDASKFLIYDSAPGTHRKTTKAPTWLTIEELSGEIEYMNVDWFCLINGTRDKNVIIDGVENKLINKTPEIDVHLLSNGLSKTISGKIVTDKLIKKYYGVVDYDKEVLVLNNVTNTLNDNFTFTFDKSVFEKNRTMHYINLYGETIDGEIISLCNLNVDILDSDSIDIVSYNEVTKVSYDEFTNNIISSNNISQIQFTFKNYDGFVSLMSDKAILRTSKVINNKVLFDLSNIDFLGKLSFDVTNEFEIYLIPKTIATKEVYKLTDENNHEFLYGYDYNLGKLIPLYQCESHLEFVDIVNPSCVEAGCNKYLCLICGFYFKNDEVIEALGHESFEYSFNENEHYHHCERCNEFYDIEQHVYSDYVTNSLFHYHVCEVCEYEDSPVRHISDSTIHHDETKHYEICTECESMFNVSKHKEHHEEGKEPTCTSDGYTDSIICEVCGYVIKEKEVIVALQHQYVNNVCIHCQDKLVDNSVKKKACGKKNEGFSLILSWISLITLAGILFKRK